MFTEVMEVRIHEGNGNSISDEKRLSKVFQQNSAKHPSIMPSPLNSSNFIANKSNHHTKKTLHPLRKPSPEQSKSFSGYPL